MPYYQKMEGTGKFSGLLKEINIRVNEYQLMVNENLQCSICGNKHKNIAKISDQ